MAVVLTREKTKGNERRIVEGAWGIGEPDT